MPGRSIPLRRTRFLASIGLALAAMVTFASSGRAVTFSNIGAGLPAVSFGSEAWGDFDNDGDLDIVTAGNGVTKVLRNSGGPSPTFTDIGAGLTGVSNAAVAWGDYDNDGDLDLVIAGSDVASTPITRIYRNDSGAFVDIGAGLPGVHTGPPPGARGLAWGDFDNDGDLDLAIMGLDAASTAITRVYRDDAGLFVDLGAGLTAVVNGSVAWGDYDRDGDLDLAVTGSGTARLYRNDAGAFFDIGAGLLGQVASTAVWGDYDADGDLDLVVTGLGIAHVYRSDGGTFVDIGATFAVGGPVTAEWGDYDNDGDLDLLLGSPGGGGSAVYRNDGGAFLNIGAGLPPTAPGDLAAWGDYDNDGRLDILLAGAIYHNDDAPVNSLPTAPTHLVSTRSGNSQTFSWFPATDPQTAAVGLSYNLRVGTTPGGDEIFASMANGANGYRRVVRIGNAQTRTSWTLNLPPGQYYWSVQAIDGAFAGSPFAAEVTPYLGVVAAGLPALNFGGAAWGDYDNDGDLDLVFTGNGIASVYRNSGGPSPSFADAGATLTGVSGSSVAWGDFDNDGDLDLVIIGLNVALVPTSRIYRNDGGAFADIAAGLPGVYTPGPPGVRAVAWGDFDNDGDLDLLITGTNAASVPLSRIYRNEGGAFVDLGAGLTGVSHSSVAWGDYDNDGDLDVALAGSDPGNVSTSKIYRNDGGAFVDIAAGLAGSLGGSIAWGDYDHDGNVDLVLASAGLAPRVYRNTGGAFADIGAGLPITGPGAWTTWGDYDNDGDLDLLIASVNESHVYRDDGGAFVDVPLGLPTAIPGTPAIWGDYDSDGKLDFLFGGTLYHNNLAPPNTGPVAPSGLKAVGVSGMGSPPVVTFSWNAATDDHTPAPALFYNLRIGTTPGGSQVSSAMAHGTSGYRRIPALGNSGERLSHTVTLPAQGVYYWSVQAIDGAFIGGPFASEQILNATLSVDEAPPARFALEGGAPNPFAQSTAVAYDLLHAEQVRIEVFDVSGHRVRTLVSEFETAGHHQCRWDGTDAHGHRTAAGLYFYRMHAGSFTGSRRAVLMP